MGIADMYMGVADMDVDMDVAGCWLMGSPLREGVQRKDEVVSGHEYLV